MNVFVSRISHNNAWVVPVSAMCLVLGFMIRMAWVTGNKGAESRQQFLSADQADRLSFGSIDLQERYAKVATEVTKLQQEKTRLENAMSSQSGEAKVLNDNLQDVKVFASLTELEGPGVMVTLSDSTKSPSDFRTDVTIHDIDALKVVNELWASGAEGISLASGTQGKSEHRISASSWIRCVGPVIHVDGDPIASPIVIRAIGDPATLLGGLNLHNGVLDEIRMTDPGMVKVESAKMLKLPAYTGPTTKKYGVAPKAKQ